MLFRIALSLLLTLLLAACAASNVKRDFSLKENPDQGIIIASVSFDRTGSRNFQAVFYMDDDTGATNFPGMRLESLPEHVMFRMGSQFKDSYGQVLALSLPAGKHTIYLWKLIRSAGYVISPSEKMTPLEFEVDAGKIRYIGNLHLNLVDGQNLFGARVIGDAAPEIRDRRERDLALIKKKYPQFADNIEIQLLPLGEWYGGGETTRVITPTVVLPVK